MRLLDDHRPRFFFAKCVQHFTAARESPMADVWAAREGAKLQAEVRIKYVDFQANRPSRWLRQS